jgi:transposase
MFAYGNFQVERARIVMGCLAGKRNDEIAAELDIRPGTVAVWRRRFAAEDMKGLRVRHWNRPMVLSIEKHL